MSPSRGPRLLSEWQFKWMLNVYPPLLFQRIRVLDVARDFRSCRVRVARSLLTRNLHGTTFGGTIFCAADPFHAMLYWQRLARRGLRVQTWLRSATVHYRKPAAVPLFLEFRVTDEDVTSAVDGLNAEGRFRRSHTVEACDASGAVCATVETAVHVRRPVEDQPADSTF